MEVFLGMVFVDLLLFLEGLSVEEGQANEALYSQGLKGSFEVLELHKDGE